MEMCQISQLAQRHRTTSRPISDVGSEAKLETLTQVQVLHYMPLTVVVNGHNCVVIHGDRRQRNATFRTDRARTLP